MSAVPSLMIDAWRVVPEAFPDPFMTVPAVCHGSDDASPFDSAPDPGLFHVKFDDALSDASGCVRTIMTLEIS